MRKKTSAAHRLLALLLAMLLALSLLPLTALAGQEDGYHDPAEHWLAPPTAPTSWMSTRL